MKKAKVEKYDAIDMKIEGLKCDACSYKDMSIQLDEYPKYVNAPCPECGANLLTEKDFKTTKRIIKIVRFLNKVLPKTKTKPSENKKSTVLEGEMNGTGIVKTSIKPNKVDSGV